MTIQSFVPSLKARVANLARLLLKFGGSARLDFREASLPGLVRTVFGALLGFAMLGTAVDPALGQTLQSTWSLQVTPNSPSARSNQVMAYDAARGQVVLFGGGAVGDTWLWNGTTWTQANPVTSPSPRVAASMAYDATRGQVVLFGGLAYNSATARLSDTWLWDGTNWTQASVNSGPPARDGQAMVYDAVHGQVVMFGGISLAGAPLNDTWLWDGIGWTQANPTHIPSSRFSHSMAYDAATSQVLLFGGETNGQYTFDTWVWSGTDWTLQNPTNGPSGRYGAGMDYDASLRQVVLFGGYNGTYLNDTWLWSGSSWTPYTPATSPSPRYFNHDMVYDAARSQMMFFGGVNYGNSPVVFNETWEFGLPGNLGNVNVCPAGQTTPSPCSNTVTLTYFFANGASLVSAPGVVNQGTPGLDFTLGTGSTCVGTVYPGSCTVNVTFTPTAPGVRTGSIQLTSASGIPQATTPIYGTGQAPAAAFGPGTQSTLNTGSYTFNQPKGLATDAAGNLYIADTGTHYDGNRNVVKIAPDGTQTNLGSGLPYPQGIAVDGSGALYVADNDLNQVIKVPAGCTTSTCQQVLPTPQCRIGVSGMCAQLGVAVDGPGNVFVASFNSEVREIPADGTAQTVLYNLSGSHPVGIKVDSAGNLYIADLGLARVVKIPNGCTSASCQALIGSGWTQPVDVAVDAAGDVFVVDAGPRQVVEVPTGCTNSGCQIVVANGIGGAVAVDAAGSVYATNLSNGTILITNRSQPPSVGFPPTNVYTTSGPLSFTLQNIGNQPLNAVSPGLITVNGPNFVSVPGSGTFADCSATFTLAPGADCNLSLAFSPQTGGPLASTAVFSDNALNAASATQTLRLSGTGVAASFPLTLSLISGGTGSVTDNLQLISCSESSVGQAVTCSANYSSGSQITLTAGATGTTIFTGWGGVCASAGTAPTCSLTINQAANVTASFVNQNFGSYNVCPAGQAVAGPCSNSMPVTFNLPTTTTIGAVSVVTQGATGLDFSQGSGSTCVGTVPGGTSCVVNVNFKPVAPGLRMGAVQLYDSNANLIATAPVYGVGQGPVIAYGPGTQTVLLNNLPTRAASVAVDASGNVFVAGGHGAVKLTPSGVQTTFPVSGIGAAGFYDVAVDGAGNVYLADSSNNRIVEIAPSGVQTTFPVTGLNFPSGVKVDGSGNVFITDRDNNRVVKGTPSGVQTTVPTTGLVRPYYPAVDAAGDVFFLDNGSQRVLKVTPAGVQSTVPTIGLIATNGVAVDAAGNVYVSDQNLNKVIEVTPAGIQTTVASSSLIVPAGLAVDAGGNLFIAVSGLSQVVLVARRQPPSLSFAQTNVGSTSVDSPQSVAVQNIGNQPLIGSLALNLGGNFTQNSTTDCSTLFPLAPGASCSESFSFTSRSATFASGTAVFTDNSLNILPPTQTIALSGTGATNGVPGTVAVPNVVGQTQTAAMAPLATVGLTMGTVSTASSQTVPAGTILSESPVAGTQVAIGSIVNLLVSSGLTVAPPPNPLLLENNYFLTGDYVSAGVTLRGTGNTTSKLASGTITIPNYTQSTTQGVPDGADIVDAFLYWETLENTAVPSSNTGTFNNYPIVGQQIGADMPSFTDGSMTGTLRAYRASVNIYLPVAANGTRTGSGAYKVSLPDSGGSTFPLTEGASLVLIYRVLSPNFPLKSVVLYDGSALPTAPAVQVVQGFYDAVGGASGTGKATTLFANAGSWNNSVSSATLGQSNQYTAPLSTASAYAAVILSTPVNNSDNDGILDAWKTGPAAGDFHVGQPGYYDVKTSTWVGLPGAKRGQKDLFVQLDYMCGAVLTSGACDPAKENLFPSPDANGNDPLAMVQQAFAASGVQLHLRVGNAVPEDTCTDDPANPSALCQFPGQTGVIGWKNSLEFSKLYPRNLYACATGGDCTTRFPFGQKDSYHYVLFGHSLAVPAWNSRFGTLKSIKVASGTTTLVTADRGNGINACPDRITIAGVLGNPALNGVYNTKTPCADTKTMTLLTPGVPDYTYPNTTLPEPVIGITSGKVTSISGYSDLGGADSAVTLGLWLTAPNQDMSKRANVLAGTLFHEIGHTLGLSHGGLYFDTPGSYVPTFEANCKPNYQSIMNYLFQLDGVGPDQAIAFSKQTLITLNEASAGAVTQLTDLSNNPATFPTSAWYVPNTPGSLGSSATRHCDGTPLAGDQAFRVDAPISPITPPWSNGQDLNFIGVPQTQERGYNDVANMDLRQLGATGGQFAELATLLSFGSSAAPLNIGAGGSVTLGSGGSVALGSGGSVTLGSGGNVTLGSGGSIALGSGGSVTLGSGGNATVSSGAAVTPGSSGSVTLGSGGSVTLGSGGTITLGGAGGSVTLGSGGSVTLGSGGSIALGSGGVVTIPSTGGSYSIDGNGGVITLGSGGSVTLGSGGSVTLGSGGSIAMGSGGSVTLGSGGSVTLGSGGSIAFGSGGSVTLGSGGNVTLGSGGSITLGSGGSVTFGSGGSVTLGSGGTVTLGGGGNLSSSSGGSVTLGSGGSATLGAGGSVTLGSGGSVTLGSGGSVTLGSGGSVTLGSGGVVAPGSGGSVTLGSGGSVTFGSGGSVTLGSGGSVTLGSGGSVTLGSGGIVTPSGGSPMTIGPGQSYTFGSSGGSVTLGSGGSVTLGSGGSVTLGSGGTIAPGSSGSMAIGAGGSVTLGSGGSVTLGSGGSITLGSGGSVTLGSGGSVTLGSGGVVTLGTGGSVNLGVGSSSISLASVPSSTPGSGGPVATELTYETANSVVRVPTAPVKTVTPSGVRITWTAPAFGVVQTYTIYRSSNGAPAIVIGSVSGVNGNPPATQFTDTNPDLTATTVVYTVTTTLVPDTTGATPRASQPSAPAVLKNDQTIVLGPLPSSVLITSPLTVTATALSGGVPNGLQVAFSTTGACTLGSQTITNNVSSAVVVLSTTGNCTVTASQPGAATFNAANSVSGAFTVLPQGSNTQSQTITFPTLPNVQYGGSFSLSATSSSGLPVTFTASGPCMTNGVISGIGVCSITASAPGNGTYSAASLTQSFTIYPAVLKVTANSLTSVYGQPLPSLTYGYTGFVKSETASVISGAPALTTTATPTSNAGNYPITVSTGTLATPNYSFLYVNGTLTIQQAAQAALTLNTSSPLTFNQSETLSVSGGTTNGAISYAVTGPCTLLGTRLTANSGTGTCLVTAIMAGNANYKAVTSSTVNTIVLAPASQGITFTVNPPASAAYASSFTVAATGGASGNPVTFTSSGACSNVATKYTMTYSVGTCSVIANQAGNTNYAAAPTVTKTVIATGPLVTLSASTLDFGKVYAGDISVKTVTLTNTGSAPATIMDPILSIVSGGNSYDFLAFSLCPRTLAPGKSCDVAVLFFAESIYTPQTATLQVMSSAPGSPQPVVLKALVINPRATLSALFLDFGPVKQYASGTQTVTLSNPGATPLILTGISVTGRTAPYFTQTNNCGSSLNPGTSCTIGVKFSPGTVGAFGANLTVVDNAQSGGGTQSILLFGKGN